jgi:Effector protein
MSRTRAIRTGAGAAVAAAWLLAHAAPGSAAIQVDASASDADKKALAAALEDLKKNPLGKVIIDSLEHSQRTVTITFNTTPLGSGSTPSNEKGATLGSDGRTPGAGSDSTVTWNPTDSSLYPDQRIPADPTAALLHELSHSLDFAFGRDDPREYPRHDMARDEVSATRDENVYRAWKGLPQRTMYGGDFLPVDAVMENKKPPPANGGGGATGGPGPTGGGGGPTGGGGGPPTGGGGGGTTGGGTGGGTTGGGTTGGGTTGGGTTGGGTTGGGTTGGGTTGGGTTGGGTTGGGTTGGGTTGGGTTGGGTTGGP